MSSKFEGLPNVLIEAQKYGIPIISSNCPTGPNEILMNGKLGELFPVGNYNILANKLLNFLKDKKPGKNYFFTINSKFDTSKVIRPREHRLLKKIKHFH